ncbi:alpha,alpha-trehalose-phosphate synthase (UDP-forming) [Dokdonella sp.]|uniref:alpha,alpha-trehalose-phosphate synthase (UDP-forming) n=1 Tax=Dokdonella sp. TaxID=2291710 RepID=UPI001AFDD741|nr:alpha,alpha-trehalose-phosphate synthase (UDP-forming) [Dokdonella sp.]MBO9664815.1 alpha,alpha-trehalose-phosphate synthase (UDP-forming) [Dokdonella sp.]
MSRLVVVSNRVALPKETRAGGLASAMQAALAERGGLWFGWSGRLVEESERSLEHRSEGRVEYALLDLTRADYQEYYLGFANRTLWPLLHFRQALLDYSRKDFAGYQRVNRLFAEHVARLLRPGDQLWVHDYHLIPLGAELRRLGVDAHIGFFLHVPLPPRDLLAALPHHEHVFSALAAYDLVGLQTESDLQALRGYFRDECSAEIDGTQLRLPDGRRFRAAVFPIGIDTERVARQAERAANSAATKRLIASLEHRRLAIGVDRLDYSKGLPQRFEAFGRFLSHHPEWRSKLSLLQIAPPSREDVPEYRELRSRLERLAGATNGRYAEPDWVPIRYVNRSFQQETLAGFYRSAHVGLVTPLRDGMNLVAKEFVAAQAPDDPGVLVLSNLAGAARELHQAIIINPLDPDDIVESLETALAMPLDERRERWAAMIEHLRRHDITAWRNAFLHALGEA